MSIQLAFGAIILAMITGFGDYLLKMSSTLQGNHYSSFYAWGGAMAYAVTAFGWIHIMLQTNLVVVSVIYSAITALVLIALSQFVFSEEVSARQYFCAGLALVAILGLAFE